MTTKVNNTVSHKTSQGDVIVTKGRLILIPYTVEEALSDKYPNLPKIGKPIIISETEKIEVDDWAYNKVTGSIERIGKDLAHYTYLDGEKRIWFKILALPEHFTPKQLQTIIDGKMKDGDEVYVECINSNPRMLDEAKYEDTKYSIKLNSDNHITLHKVEQKMYTKEEVIALLSDLNITINRTSGGLALGETEFYRYINQHL